MLLSASSTFRSVRDLTYTTVAEASAAEIQSDVDVVSLLGYSAAGDGGGAKYNRVVAEPSHNLKFQDALGAWWEINEVFVTPEMAGAVNDGSTADDTAFDDVYDYLMTLPTGGTMRLLPGDGYVLEAAHNFYPSVELRIEWAQGAKILNNLAGAANVLLDFTNPSTPTTRGDNLTLVDPAIQYISGFSGVGSVHIQYRYASDMKIQGNKGSILGYANNTCVRLAGLWNCDFTPLSVWGGGVYKAYKDPATTAIFSITSGATALTCTEDHFSAGDVGKSITLFSPSGTSQVFEIATFVNAQSVTTTKTAINTLSSVYGAWEGAKGTISASSTTLTMNASVLSASDVGRVVYVMNADDGTTRKYPLRATIASVTSATECELDTAATATATAQPVVFSPAVEIYSESAAQKTNDFTWDGLHIEQFRGTGFALTDAVNVSMSDLKLHALNTSVSTTQFSTFRGIFAQVHGRIDSGDFEGSPVEPIGSIHISGLGLGLQFGGLLGVGINDQPVVYAENLDVGGHVSIDEISFSNTIHSRTMDKVLVKSGTSGSVSLRGAANSLNSTYSVLVRSGQARYYGTQNPYGLSPLASVVATSSSTGAAIVDAQTIGNSNSPIFRGYHANGTVDAPTVISDFNACVSLQGYGRAPDGTDYLGGYIYLRVNGLGASKFTTEWRFATTTSGATSATDKVLITNAGNFNATTDNSQTLGTASVRWGSTYSTKVYIGAGTAYITSGTGTPEGSVTAPVGSLYTRTDGGAGTTLYVKESGSGNTGWVAK